MSDSYFGVKNIIFRLYYEIVIMKCNSEQNLFSNSEYNIVF